MIFQSAHISRIVQKGPHPQHPHLSTSLNDWYKVGVKFCQSRAGGRDPKAVAMEEVPRVCDMLLDYSAPQCTDW